MYTPSKLESWSIFLFLLVDHVIRVWELEDGFCFYQMRYSLDLIDLETISFMCGEEAILLLWCFMLDNVWP